MKDSDFYGLSAQDVLDMFEIPSQGVEFYGLLKAFNAKNPLPPPTQPDMINVCENESISINDENFVNTTSTTQVIDGQESMDYEEEGVSAFLMEDCIVQDHSYLVQHNTPPQESPQQNIPPQELPQQNTPPNAPSKCKILLFH